MEVLIQGQVENQTQESEVSIQGELEDLTPVESEDIPDRVSGQPGRDSIKEVTEDRTTKGAEEDGLNKGGWLSSQLTEEKLTDITTFLYCKLANSLEDNM